MKMAYQEKNICGSEASNITVINNHVVSRLTNKRHHGNKCSSQAAKALPHKYEDLMRNIYKHLSHTAKRIFFNVKSHKILYLTFFFKTIFH